MIKKITINLIPWLITVVALYFAFSGLDWGLLKENLVSSNPLWISLAIFCTCISYLLRSFRWLYFFPDKKITYPNAAKVLTLGFFMNNILPARAGEFVRAHMGSKVTGEKRTLVLATIASERLVDGLVISIMFLGFAIGLGGQKISTGLIYVAALFGGATACVILTLILRNYLFALTEKVGNKFNHRFFDYIADRLQVFIHGLSPLASWSRLPAITVLSLVVWFIELAVYSAVSNAFGAGLSLPHCVLFLVAVNFSSLIPSAPGAIGVIEAVGTAILVAIGVPRELALSMVVTQHIIQYLVVGIPGLWIMVTWRGTLKKIRRIQ